jgi:hypothetical protein
MNESENFTLKMKISFEEVSVPDVLLYAGTQNSSNFSILWAFSTKLYFFPHLTLKIYDLDRISKGCYSFIHSFIRHVPKTWLLRPIGFDSEVATK